MSEGKPRPTGKMVLRDRNYYPEMEITETAVASIWRNKERKGDLEKAQKFAQAEGYEVIVYPQGTRDPIGKAKAYMRELHGG
jgi:1-acyl-sn-glycerol-3-phosphate acyltransferase